MLNSDYKDFLLRTIRAYEDLLGLESAQDVANEPDPWGEAAFPKTVETRALVYSACEIRK